MDPMLEITLTSTPPGHTEKALAYFLSQIVISLLILQKNILYGTEVNEEHSTIKVRALDSVYNNKFTRVLK